MPCWFHPAGTVRRKWFSAASTPLSGQVTPTPPAKRTSFRMAASTTGTASRMARYRSKAGSCKGIYPSIKAKGCRSAGRSWGGAGGGVSSFGRLFQNPMVSSFPQRGRSTYPA